MDEIDYVEETGCYPDADEYVREAIRSLIALNQEHGPDALDVWCAQYDELRTELPGTQFIRVSIPRGLADVLDSLMALNGYSPGEAVSIAVIRHMGLSDLLLDAVDDANDGD